MMLMIMLMADVADAVICQLQKGEGLVLIIMIG